MRRFLNILLRDFRTTGSARGGRRAPRGAALQVEGLEDRLVLTSAGLSHPFFSTLTINNVAPDHGILLQCDPNNNNEIEVFDGSTLVFHFGNKQLISTVNIRLSSNDVVDIDDSNGMPFAQKALVSLSSSGTGNSLAMGGSRTISGNETYVAGAGSSSGGEVLVDNISFQLSPTITKVTDFFPITGTDDVQTSGTNVVLAGDDPILTACPEFRPGTRARGLLAPGVSRPSGARGGPEMAASHWPGRRRRRHPVRR